MTNPSSAPEPVSRPLKIGIYKTRYAGDVLLLVPLLHKLRTAYPGSSLFLVVNEGTEDPLRLLGIFNVPFQNRNLIQKTRSVREILGMVRRESFDYWFDLTLSDRSRYISRHVSSGRKIGAGWESDHFGSDPYDLFVPFDYDRGPEHIVSFHENVFRSAGLTLPAGPPDFTFPLELEARDHAGDYLESLRFHDAPILVLHPGGRHWFKRWPPDRFGRFANWWGQTTGGVIIVAGTNSEDTLLDSVGAAIGPKVRWAKLQGSLSLLRAVLARSSLFIGNDSAPMHLARSVGIPGIALFGSTRPSVWGPLGSDRFRTLYKSVECSPCRHVGCTLGEGNCLREISVDDAVRAATDLMTHFGGAER